MADTDTDEALDPTKRKPLEDNLGMGPVRVASPMGAPSLVPPISRPVSATGVPMYGQGDAVPATGTAPTVNPHVAEAQRMEQSGSGVSQVQANHPFWGGVLRGLDVASTIAAPGIAAAIPGTTLHHDQLIHQQEGLANQDVVRDEKQAQTSDLEAQTQQRLHPPPIKETPEEKAYDYEVQQGKNPVEALGGVKQTEQDVKPAGPEDRPLGDQRDNLNKILESRYQVLAPGQPLPTQFSLPANATMGDYSRIDKALESQEHAVGTRNQQEQTNAFKQQAQAMMAQAHALAANRANEAEEKSGMKWASWTDPKSGRTVAGPVSAARTAGATDATEVPAQEIRDIQNARSTYHIITKVGDPSKPETNGVLQLIDELDKEGQLGVLASRYNRMVTQGVGASPGDDPRIITLIDKNMLGQTGAMLTHFGASGGRSPQMLQHFEDLANAGKMDGVTLRAGTKAIADYMHDKGMIADKADEGTGGALTIELGGKHYTYNGTGSKKDIKNYTEVAKP